MNANSASVISLHKKEPFISNFQCVYETLRIYKLLQQTRIIYFDSLANDQNSYKQD